MKRLLPIMLIGGFLCTSCTLSAQVFLTNDNSNMLCDDSTYSCRVSRILRLHDGYLIEVKVGIDTNNACAWLVSPHVKGNRNGTKIRKGGTYPLQMKRYFLSSAYAGIEGGFTVDVMLGEKTVSINNNGSYTYLFTSPNIEGTTYIKSTLIDKGYQDFTEERDSIASMVEQLCSRIAVSQNAANIADFVDTTAFMRCFHRYGTPVWGRNPDFKLKQNYSPKIKWAMAYKVPKDQGEWLNGGFSDVFQRVLKKYYNLPSHKMQDYPNGVSVTDLSVQLLYASGGIYTLRVGWKYPDSPLIYDAILNVRKTAGVYKCVGLNRAYCDCGISIPPHKSPPQTTDNQ